MDALKLMPLWGVHKGCHNIQVLMITFNIMVIDTILNKLK